MIYASCLGVLLLIGPKQSQNHREKQQEGIPPLPPPGGYDNLTTAAGLLQAKGFWGYACILNCLILRHLRSKTHKNLHFSLKIPRPSSLALHVRRNNVARMAVNPLR